MSNLTKSHFFANVLTNNVYQQVKDRAYIIYIIYDCQMTAIFTGSFRFSFSNSIIVIPSIPPTDPFAFTVFQAR